MSRRLIVITDLWGLNKAEWIDAYLNPLRPIAEIHVYDSRVLAGIDAQLDSEEGLHQAFVQGGIEVAVQRLCELERSSVEVLAFSIGGAIAWKAALSGLQMTRLVALSATRLRKEVERPESVISLYFGEEDPYRPSTVWEHSMSLKSTLTPRKGHEYYREASSAEHVLIEML